jgi:hypothetical protein
MKIQLQGARTIWDRGSICASLICLLALICPAAAGEAGTLLPPLPANRPSLVISPDREFSATSYVHAPLPANAPVAAKSQKWVTELQRQVAKNYGLVAVNIDTYTPPLYVVGAGVPTVRVRAERASEPGWRFEPLQQQWLDVPLPKDFEPSAGTDKEAIVYQPDTGRYWEFWGMEKSGRSVKDSAGNTVPEWRAAWGGQIMDLKSSPGYFVTTPQGYKFGTAATGMALLGGLITIAEQRAGKVSHAIHIALPETQRAHFVHPAQRTDGQKEDADAIPQGTTFRLPATLDVLQLQMDPYARMLAQAAKDHGIVVRDTAGAVVLYAENPLTKGKAHPYFGANGILKCPLGIPEPSCYPDSNNRLRGFPWEKLEALAAPLRP